MPATDAAANMTPIIVVAIDKHDVPPDILKLAVKLKVLNIQHMSLITI